MSQTAELFIARSRYHLSQDFLPRIERCLDLLSDEQIWWRANEKSNSIGNLVLHLCGNARQWIVCGIGGAADGRDRDAEFARREVIGRSELQTLLRSTLGEVDAALAAFDSSSLPEHRTIQGLEVTALEAILHVVEHFSMHTGQIILVTKMLAESDLSFYEFIDAKPILKWNRQPA